MIERLRVNTLVEIKLQKGGNGIYGQNKLLCGVNVKKVL